MDVDQEQLKHEENVSKGQKIIEGFKDLTSTSAKPLPRDGKRKRGKGYTRKIKAKSKRYIKMQKASRKINRKKRRKT